MRMSSQMLLTFLLNAIWQVALIAALAALGAWLLRNSGARYRHWVWACALCLAFLVPAVTSSRVLFETDVQPELTFARGSIAPFQVETSPPSLPETSPTILPPTFRLNQTLGLALLGIYFGFLLYRIFKLSRIKPLSFLFLICVHPCKSVAPNFPSTPETLADPATAAHLKALAPDTDALQSTAHRRQRQSPP
jgi:hypothetical protein